MPPAPLSSDHALLLLWSVQCQGELRKWLRSLKSDFQNASADALPPSSTPVGRSTAVRAGAGAAARGDIPGTAAGVSSGSGDAVGGVAGDGSAACSDGSAGTDDKTAASGTAMLPQRPRVRHPLSFEEAEAQVCNRLTMSSCVGSAAPLSLSPCALATSSTPAVCPCAGSRPPALPLLRVSCDGAELALPPVGAVEGCQGPVPGAGTTRDPCGDQRHVDACHCTSCSRVCRLS
jgi:hypothetical protein